MSTLSSPTYVPRAAAGPPAPSCPAADHDDPGLKSAGGIRWLLFVGALVVIVSLIRLVASQWGLLPQSIQFLSLCVGALGIYGAGEITRRRLHLPSAGGALFSLFAVAVPVLAWGAAHQNLILELPGAVAVFVGLGTLGWAAKRLMATVFDYRGWTLPACFTLLLVALPAGSVLDWPLPATATLLGAVLAFACRHINRFFFHRDRVSGIERPVHALPFLFLVGLYLANVLELGAGGSEWALAMVFVALALADAGEEYLRALTRAVGEMPATWPRRSLGLLAAGATTGAFALGLALFAGDPLSVVWVTGGCCTYLIAWTFRYRQAATYAAALPLGLIALHTLPALLTGLRDQFVQLASDHFGYSGFVGKASAAAGGELALLAILVVAGACLRLPKIHRLTSRSMFSVHGWTTAILACWTLAITSVGLNVMAQVAPMVCLLCLAAAWILRHPAPLFPAHLGIMAGAFAWIGPVFDLEPSSPFILALNATLAVAYGWALKVRSNSGRPTSSQSTGWILAAPMLTAGALLAFDISLLSLHTLPSFNPWVAMWSIFPVLVLGLRLELPKLAAPATAVLLCILEWAMLTTLPWPTGITALLFNGLLIVVFGWALRLRESAASKTDRAAMGSGFFTALVLGLLWVPGTAFVGGGAAAAAAFFLWVAGCALLDGALITTDTSGSRNAGIAMLGLGLAPGLLASAVVPGLAGPLPMFALWVGGVWALNRTVCSPRSIYFLGRLYRSRPSAVANLESLLNLVSDSAYRSLSYMAIMVCLLWTGPWVLAISTLILADAWFRRAADSPALGDHLIRVFGLLWLAHWALLTAGSPFLFQALLDSAGTLGFALVRLMVGLALWQEMGRRMTASPWAAWMDGALQISIGILIATVLPTGWPGIAALGVAVYFIARQVKPARLNDDRNAAWIAQGWSVAGLVGLTRLTAFELSAPWLSLMLIGVAFIFLFVRDALLAKNRPSIAASLTPTGTALALLGAILGSVVTAPWVGFAALPLGLASVYFALHVDRHLWQPAAAIAALLFVGCTFELLVLFPALGAEAYLIGPGLALLAGAVGLKRRLGPRFSRYLFTLGAGCLYAVPFMALMRHLSWGSLILLLVMSVAFGAMSFRLRSRSLLLTSTGAVLIDLGFFLFMISRIPSLLWVLGLVFGLGLMAIAAFLESRKEHALQQARLWRQELQSWS